MGHGGCGRLWAVFKPLVASAALVAAATVQPAGGEEPPKPAPAKDQAEAAPKPAPEKPAADDPFGQDAAKDNGAGALDKAREALQRAKEAAEKAQPQARPLPAQIQMRGGAPMNRRLGIRIGGVVTDAGDDEPIFFPADRTTLQRLSKAQELLELKRFGEAVRLLGDILDGPEDFFFQPKRDEPIHRSLKAEAQRLIGSLPAEGRDSYELQYGALRGKSWTKPLPSATPRPWPKSRGTFSTPRRATKRPSCSPTINLIMGIPWRPRCRFGACKVRRDASRSSRSCR